MHDSNDPSVLDAVRKVLKGLKSIVNQRTPVRLGPPQTPGTRQRKRRRNRRRGGW